MPKDTIAFISTYEHPSRDSVERTIRTAFPEYRVENIHLLDVIKRHRGWIAPNLWYVMREYGPQLLSRTETLRDSYLRTTYLFRQIQQAMRAVIDSERHVFSFQTQSLYDTSVPGVPHFIYTDHTHLSNRRWPGFEAHRLRSKKWIALERCIYENARCVFTRSDHVTADVIRHYEIDPRKVECVFAGSNVLPGSGAPLQNDNYGNRTVLFVGSDWVRKGGPVLAEAFERVLVAHPDARLVIAGAQPGLGLRNCTVLGPVSLEDLANQYARASVFCLPTRLEPFGIAVLEAMAYRLPVVATRAGAIPEMVEDGVTGCLVAPDDVEGLAGALIALLGDAARCRTLGEAGHRRAIGTYTWQRVGERLRTRILPEIAVPSALAGTAGAVAEPRRAHLPLRAETTG